MPYILPEARTKVMLEGAHSAGELNYEITVAILTYMSRMGLTYQTIADIRSACMGAMSEFDRRIAFPYEDEAIDRNGDIDGYSSHS